AAELRIDAPHGAVGRAECVEGALMPRIGDAGKADLLVQVRIERKLMPCDLRGGWPDAPDDRGDVAGDDDRPLRVDGEVRRARVDILGVHPARQLEALPAVAFLKGDGVDFEYPDALPGGVLHGAQ